MKIYLGSGRDSRPGFTRYDCDPSVNPDILGDCAVPDLPRQSVDVAFSHAFWEHLWPHEWMPHLRAIRQALKPDGYLLYAGIPFWDAIIELIQGGYTDVHELHRHIYAELQVGDPEAGLHKGLPSVDGICDMLMEAGFHTGGVYFYNHLDEKEIWGGCFYAAASKILYGAASIAELVPAANVFAMRKIFGRVSD